MRRWKAARAWVAGVVPLSLVVGVFVTAEAAIAAAAPSPRCPAPGEMIDDAISTAPLRHSRAELVAIRQAIEPKPPWPTDSPIQSIGDGRDTVEIALAPGREDVAARLVRRYRDAVRIHVGAVLYVPRGCGIPPAPQRCPDLTGDPPSTAGLQLSVIADTPRIKASEPGRARLQIRNVGTNEFSIDSGVPLVGSLVRRDTNHVVGNYSGGVGGVGGGVHLAPGATGTIGMMFGAARCDGHAGSALPPGRYGLRVVLTPEGPPGGDLSPRLLSPETIITVTR